MMYLPFSAVAMASTHLFVDIEPRIADKSVFMPPSNCKMVETLNLPRSTHILFERVTQGL